MADARPNRPTARPLSPHLSIYRFTWTMAMSIVHRVTGTALYFATPLLAVWLWTVADGEPNYEVFAGLAASWFGLLVLIGLSWALIHHAIGGVRHIVWDTGTGVDRASRFLWAKATLAGSVVLTALLWFFILLGGQ
jgi:succinate dehydrogenase / fumarate reductase cytochrome b subunit